MQKKNSFGSVFTSGRFLYYFFGNVDTSISGQKLTKKTVHWLGSVLSYNLYTVVIIPLVGDHDGEEDRSNEDDVVDWEQNSGKYHRVQFIMEGYWPVEF